jgi:glutaconate CoA-transferase subunit B
LPGSGGACEIAIHAKRIFIIMRLMKRAFVERVDFITSRGHLGGGPSRRAARGIPGRGPELVVTDKAILNFDTDTGEMVLTSIHPGVTVEAVQSEVSWPLRVADPLSVTEPPSAEELRLIRQELDSEGTYT